MHAEVLERIGVTDELGKKAVQAIENGLTSQDPAERRRNAELILQLLNAFPSRAAVDQPKQPVAVQVNVESWARQPAAIEGEVVRDP